MAYPYTGIRLKRFKGRYSMNKCVDCMEYFYSLKQGKTCPWKATHCKSGEWFIRKP